MLIYVTKCSMCLSDESKASKIVYNNACDLAELISTVFA